VEGVADPFARHKKETTQTIPKDLVWVVNRRFRVGSENSIHDIQSIKPMLNQIRRPFFRYRNVARTPSPSNVQAVVVGSGITTLSGVVPMGVNELAAKLASGEGELSALATFNMQRDNPATHKVAANRL
jgi:hypothetical protein